MGTVAAAFGRFVAANLVVALVIGLAGAWVLLRATTAEALWDARQLTRVLATIAIEPGLEDGLLEGDPAAIARMDALIRNRVLRDPVVRVKLWDADGRVLYSDERALVGSVFPLGDDERRALLGGEMPVAELSDLSAPENSFEPDGTRLLEVYHPVRTRTGVPLLFETYQRAEDIEAASRRVWWRVLPAAAGVLLLLSLVQLPLALSLARRVQRTESEHRLLLQRTLTASDEERRRIAGDLHDGVVQTLAGVSYGLAALSDRWGPGAPSSVGAALQAQADATRRSIRELRTLLVSIYPPDLRRTGLAAALSDLLAGLAARGISTRLTVQPGLELPAAIEALCFRGAQELIRNVLRHAEAGHVDVAVHERDGSVVLTVTDDGLGFEAERPAGGATSPPHFGLLLLEESARDAGGELTVAPAPRAGTRVCLTLPAR